MACDINAICGSCKVARAVHVTSYNPFRSRICYTYLFAAARHAAPQSCGSAGAFRHVSARNAEHRPSPEGWLLIFAMLSGFGTRLEPSGMLHSFEFRDPSHRSRLSQAFLVVELASRLGAVFFRQLCAGVVVFVNLYGHPSTQKEGRRRKFRDLVGAVHIMHVAVGHFAGGCLFSNLAHSNRCEATFPLKCSQVYLLPRSMHADHNGLHSHRACMAESQSILATRATCVCPCFL